MFFALFSAVSCFTNCSTLAGSFTLLGNPKHDEAAYSGDLLHTWVQVGAAVGAMVVNDDKCAEGALASADFMNRFVSGL